MAFLSSSHHHTPFSFSTEETATLLLLLSFHAICCSCQNNTTTNTLLQGQSISQNQTLISNNKRYALGFFSPTNPPSKYYIGIWFNQISNTTVVWVGNRENPLTDPSSGSFTIAPDGNLALLNATDQATLWSTNISSIDTNTSAVLLDSGNLVLQRVANDTNNFANSTIWQSFDNPSNTLLPDMKLYLNLSTKEGNKISSWRTSHDPSPGEFSAGIDPATTLQLMIWNGTQVWRRITVFAGETFTAFRDDASSSFAGFLLNSNNQFISYSFRMVEGSNTLWLMLDPEGVYRFFLWEPTSDTWRALSSDPGACYYYNPCGPNAACSLNSTALECECLRGYAPKSAVEWREGNHEGGCSREVELECGDGDGFAKVGGVFLPDGFAMVRNASREECERWCVGRCGCTAYAFSNKSVVGSSTTCLVWEGDLVDVKTADGPGDGHNLYLRLAASELETNGSSSKGKTIALATILPLVALGIILLGIFLYLRKKRSMQNNRKGEIVIFEDFKIPQSPGDKKSGNLLPLDFSKLLAATNNFSMENKIGEGGFGPVYKGKLHEGQEIAIKVLSKCSNQGFAHFKNEVELIARVQHRNLVKILGWCIHDNEKMVIYEYMPNKSLDKFVFDPSLKGELNWVKRFNIIHGIAQGLLYLHKYSRLRIIHRDLKTSNILLDEAMNPKISDFGLAKTIENDQNEANTQRVTGTLGYMSPEYAFDGLFSEKSDVFSFGVILLEIITGKKVNEYYPYKKSFNLLGYVWQHWLEGESLELLDAAMGKEFSEQEVLDCIQIALLCVQESAFDRPSTQSLVSMLTTENASLPSPKQPAFSAERCLDNESLLSETLTSVSVNASTHLIRNHVMSI